MIALFNYFGRLSGQALPVRLAVAVFCMLAGFPCAPAGAQSIPAGAPLPGGEQPVVPCSAWKPTWESTPLPNGRTQPYIQVPLIENDLKEGVLGPMLLGEGLIVHLYIRTPGGALQPLAISRQIAGPPAPAPPTVRVFWQEPPGGFSKDARMVVLLEVRATGIGPASAARTNVQPAWLRYDLPGGIPTIDRSALGPVETSGSANYVPNQLMLNGSTAPAFHASVRLGLASLSPQPQSDRVYVLSDDLLSNRTQDASTRLRLAVGVVHSLPSQELDIAPNTSAEAWVQSNQAGTNQGTGVSLGRLILGRRWRQALGRDFLYAALTPRFQLSPLQYNYLFKRDTRLDPGFTEKSYVDPAAEIILSPFFIGLKPGQTATIAGTPNLSLDIKGWYVTGLGPEYRYTIRLQVPAHIWVLSDVGISYYRGADQDSYFRYSSGVALDFSLEHGKLF